MKIFRFKIEDYINPSHFIWIKEKTHFKAMNITRQIFPIDKYKVTFTSDENNIKFS